MGVSVKVGSVVKIPVLASWQVLVSDPTVVSAVITSGIVTFVGLKPGKTWVTLMLAADLRVALEVTVAA